MAKVTFLGTGSAFSKKHGKSSILVESGEIKLLIDCGSTVPSSLQKYGVSFKDLTHIFITHLHYDHIGGLEEMAMRIRFEHQYRPVLISTASILERLWLKSLRGGLEYIEAQPGDTTPQTLNDFFKPVAVQPNHWFPIQREGGVEMILHPADHIQLLEAYSIWIRETPESTPFCFSGDTRFDQDFIKQSAEACNLIFHDCQLFDTGLDNSLGVHASYNQLAQLPPGIKSKMWFYHYGDTELPDAEADGFPRFAQVLQSFEV